MYVISLVFFGFAVRKYQDKYIPAAVAMMLWFLLSAMLARPAALLVPYLEFLGIAEKGIFAVMTPYRKQRILDQSRYTVYQKYTIFVGDFQAIHNITETLHRLKPHAFPVSNVPSNAVIILTSCGDHSCHIIMLATTREFNC